MNQPPSNPARAGTRKAMPRRYPLGRPARLSLENVAHRCGLHPDLVRRFVVLGLVDASHDAAGALWFTGDAPAAIARAQRLRSGLCLNYAAIGLVMELLDRIDVLEAALRRAGAPRPQGDVPIGQARNDPSWT
jgi:hypothetical protein